jgi:hypothetical protein
MTVRSPGDAGLTVYSSGDVDGTDTILAAIHGAASVARSI